ncbi:MAG: hypothetical protein JNL96_13740 [Planctomycetaceae bacterium]|nr:hypothetical protein [Planctomycetaceae bacterium]
MTLYTLSDAVASGIISRTTLERIIADNPTLGIRTVGGTLLLRPSDLRRIAEIRREAKPRGRPKKITPPPAR